MTGKAPTHVIQRNYKRSVCLSGAHDWRCARGGRGSHDSRGAHDGRGSHDAHGARDARGARGARDAVYRLPAPTGHSLYGVNVGHDGAGDICSLVLMVRLSQVVSLGARPCTRPMTLTD